jgi:hypothetical protein
MLYPGILSPGAGAVDVYNNLIQNNLGNDDGGGLRFLMSGNFPYRVYNNIIANNVSTHEGAGISINDAPMSVFNNTIMKNLPRPRLSPATACLLRQRSTPLNSGCCSSVDRRSPLRLILQQSAMFNNIFWDNRAGTSLVQPSQH